MVSNPLLSQLTSHKLTSVKSHPMKFIKVKFSQFKLLINSIFPDYRGHKVQLVIHDSGTMTLSQTYWSGGSRSYYAGVNLQSGQFGHLQSTQVHPWYSQVEGKEVPLTETLVVLEHRFSGTHQWIWIHIHPSILQSLQLTDVK
jgi:hypothetical protein